MSIVRFVGAFALAGLALAPTAMAPARAGDTEAYPMKPVRIIVPYGAGGIADVTMRMVAKQLSEHFDQQFFVDNRPGAGGILAMKAVQEAQPDGYTLFMIGGGLTIAKALFKSLPYNIETDFTPISTTASYGLVIATKAGSPLKSVNDIIAAAKANPGKLNFGTINAGSTQNLSAELFRIMAGIKVTTIPYKTTPDLALAVLRGDIDVAFDYYPGFQSAIAEGRMTAVATTGAERAANLPNVPTVIESGLPGYEVTSWNGIAAPAGTPQEIVLELNHAVDDALASRDVQKYSAAAGMDARGMSPKELAKRVHADVVKWTNLIDQAGIQKH
ncbi:MAG TPA: tripartite tricarboxylate transporter substrate-binding protein [Pseudolabrys sp.]|nr:tripartite tricarboxylate transporter substrate-binding protein [Pseudolabrys sp.]